MARSMVASWRANCSARWRNARIATQAGLHRHLARKRRRPPAGTADRESARHRLQRGALAALGFAAGRRVFSAEQAVVALSKPRFFARGNRPTLDRFVGRNHAERKPSILRARRSERDRRPFRRLVASYENGAPAIRRRLDLTFLRHARPGLAQSRAVVLQALDYLKRDSARGSALFFRRPTRSRWAWREELRRLGIPLDDGTGALAPGLFEQRCWQTWLALQEEPGVPRLIAWLRACEAQGVSVRLGRPLSARDVADVLESALGESLVDDLDFLARHLEDNPHEQSRGAQWPISCAGASPSGGGDVRRFLDTDPRGLALPGWEDHLARLQIDPPAWLRKRDETAFAAHVPRMAAGIDRFANPDARRGGQSFLRQGPSAHLRADDRPDAGVISS